MDAQEKEAKLIEWLREKGRIAIAFSGGVDSTYLLRVAIDALGSDNVLPMHAQAQLHSRREEHEAEDYARDMGAHLVVLPMDMHAVPGLCDNPPDRCYICKTAVFTALWDYARAHGFDTLADGSNADDVGDYRPGMRALKELGVSSPLKEIGMTKAEIRQRSAFYGLPTAGKPALACLATRIPYGTKLEEAVLRRIDLAETALFAMGLTQVRVRAHGNVARIEVPKEDILAVAQRIPEAVVYELTDCLANQDYDGAMRILADLLADKSNTPIFLLAVIGQQMRRLYAARLARRAGIGTSELREMLGVPYDFIAENLLRSARKFTGRQLEEAVRLCAQADFAMKSSGADDVALLKELLLRIAVGGAA